MSALHDYENFLLGRIKKVPYASSSLGGVNETQSLDIIRYAIEGILGWTPKEAISRFDEYIIKHMKLEEIISYILFPVEIPQGTPEYILYLLYPNLIAYGTIESVIAQYQQILSGKNQFPKNYFSGEDGFYRYCYCLKYILVENNAFSSIYDIFDYCNSYAGKTFIDAHYLYSPARQLGINILDAVRHITRNMKGSDLYYSVLMMEKEMKTQKKMEEGLCCE